jgi:hypothetical protein
VDSNFEKLLAVVNENIELARTVMESSDNTVHIFRAQGAIEMLKNVAEKADLIDKGQYEKVYGEEEGLDK